MYGRGEEKLILRIVDNFFGGLNLFGNPKEG
jgi:hypothetical protein